MSVLCQAFNSAGHQVNNEMQSWILLYLLTRAAESQTALHRFVSMLKRSSEKIVKNASFEMPGCVLYVPPFVKIILSVNCAAAGSCIGVLKTSSGWLLSMET